MRMSNIHLSTDGIPAVKRGPGRVPLYGEKAVTRPVSYPPALLDKLRAEAAWRAAKAGNPEEWTVSRLVVDICYEHFGMPNPSRESTSRD
jgi:hypothetical protein